MSFFGLEEVLWRRLETLGGTLPMYQLSSEAARSFIRYHRTLCVGHDSFYTMKERKVDLKTNLTPEVTSSLASPGNGSRCVAVLISDEHAGQSLLIGHPTPLGSGADEC